MAGSIRGSDTAERAAATPRRWGAGSRAGGERRWAGLRRAAGARLASFGAAVTLVALLAAVAAPLLAPYDPLKQDLGNSLARPGRTQLPGAGHVGRGVVHR